MRCADNYSLQARHLSQRVSTCCRIADLCRRSSGKSCTSCSRAQISSASEVAAKEVTAGEVVLAMGKKKSTIIFEILCAALTGAGTASVMVRFMRITCEFQLKYESTTWAGSECNIK